MNSVFKTHEIVRKNSTEVCKDDKDKKCFIAENILHTVNIFFFRLFEKDFT